MMHDQPGRGLFITLEGGEGAGKSTLVRALEEGLRADGREVVLTREPGGSPLGERIRALLLQGAFKGNGPAVEAVAFAAARSDHLSKVILPALARGAVVVCDRFFDSTRAYQGYHGVDAGLLDTLEREAVGPWRPDLTLLLDLDPRIGLARAVARRGTGEVDRFEGEDMRFHEGVRAAFLGMAAREPGRFHVLDASRAPDEVAEDAMAETRARAEALMGPSEGDVQTARMA